MNRCEYFSAAQPALRSSYPFQIPVLPEHIFLKASCISSDVTVVQILNKHTFFGVCSSGKGSSQDWAGQGESGMGVVNLRCHFFTS